MECSNKTRTVQFLYDGMTKRKNLSLKHKLQRPEGQWKSSTLRDPKSLLIDSMTRDIPLNPIYTVQIENGYAVIDGVQRLSTTRDFINDGFALKKLDDVIIDGVTYNLSGKKFSELDEEVRSKILSAEIVIYYISNYTDDEVREMFLRQNGGKPLSKKQLRVAYESNELIDIISGLANHSFFEKVLSKAQFNNSVNTDAVLQVLMLSEKTDSYDFGTFKESDVIKFIKYYEEKLNNPETKGALESKLRNIEKALDRLDEEFGDDVKIKQTTLPFAIYSLYRVYKDAKSTEKWIEWFKGFLDGYNDNTEYLQYCGRGTSSSESINGRLNYFRNVIRSL